MKNQTSLLRWAGMFALSLVVLAFAGHSASATSGTKDAKAEKRADVITIDAMAAHGELSMPPVTFLHDQHTKAMQKDCSSCHKPVEDGQAGKFSFRYMGVDGVKADALKEHFHANCISCHIDMAKVRKKTGPLEAECRSCHNPRPAVDSDWQDIGFDKRMHYEHTASSQIVFEGYDTNCGTCHHVYDPTTQKLVWGKNQEDSCRACHLTLDQQKAALEKNPKAEDSNGLLQQRPTLDMAAHQSCVNCHLAVTAKNQTLKSGPTDCAGCHSPAAQEAFAETSAKTSVNSIPRLMRGQADAILMMPTPEKAEIKSMMRPVSFNHKFHESMTSDCRTCHHKKIAACSTCHSYEGKAEANFVNFAQAMHKSTARQSCVGCHNQQTQSPSCAGCHTQIPAKMAADSCNKCHTVPVGVSTENAENGSLLKLGKEDRQRLADQTVAQRTQSSAPIYRQEDIPEKVVIGLLSNEYQPSELPHRKIVNALWEKQKDNRLAAAFHTEEATLCQGCHHNSPPSKTPPKCVSCHSADVKSAKDGRLGLKAAYHQQCMTCHARMNQKPAETECADCHKTRAN